MKKFFSLIMLVVMAAIFISTASPTKMGIYDKDVGICATIDIQNVQVAFVNAVTSKTDYFISNSGNPARVSSSVELVVSNDFADMYDAKSLANYFFLPITDEGLLCKNKTVTFVGSYIIPTFKDYNSTCNSVYLVNGKCHRNC